MAVYESPGPGRVLIAVGAGPLVAEPSWTRFDALGDTCRCFGFDWNRGRQSEFDVTEAGRARVFFHDLAQTLNDTSLVGLQIMLQLYDPVEDAWEPCFRGTIDRIDFEASPGAPDLTNVDVSAVGVFAYLARAKMVVADPPVMGDPLPPPMTGVVFYEDGPVATGTNDPNDGGRIERLLFDGGLDSDMYVAFSGNVDVNETLYDPQDTILSALRQAADAEFPGVANVYEDRYGRVAFHGREARFDPDGTAAGASAGAWGFTRWAAATREDVGAGVAQIREFKWSVPADRIVNSYLAWPGEDENGVTFDQANVKDLSRTDSGSIAAHGYSGIEKANLIIKQHKTNGNTGADECGLFGDYYVSNFADPKPSIELLTIVSVRPDDPRAAATWALITRCDISDVIAVTVDEGGFAAVDYYVEGIQGSCRRSFHEGWDIVTFTPNLSPASYFDDNVFE